MSMHYVAAFVGQDGFDAVFGFESPMEAESFIAGAQYGAGLFAGDDLVLYREDDLEALEDQPAEEVAKAVAAIAARRQVDASRS